jgi:hypothetical protein
MQIPCVYVPGPAPAVSVANNIPVHVHRVCFLDTRKTSIKKNQIQLVHCIFLVLPNMATSDLHKISQRSYHGLKS